MKHGLFVFAYLFFSYIFYSPFSLAEGRGPSEIVQIVGGEEAEENMWPWMTALVSIEKTRASFVAVEQQAIESNYFAFTPLGEATAELVDCQNGFDVCTEAENKICLIKRGETFFYEKALNCEAGGGLGLIIYNNIEGALNDFTLGSDFAGTIPVVVISLSDGEDLLSSALGKSVEIAVKENAELNQSSSCGASLIADKWLLTAAHCVEDGGENLHVNIGAHDLSLGADNAIKVRSIYIHPDYNTPSLLENDIALIELDTRFSIAPIKIASLADSEMLALQNSPAMALGWGSTLAYEAYPDFAPQSYPDVLRQVDLLLYNTEECKEIVRNADSLLTPSPRSADGIKDNMLCAGVEDGSKDVCNGDSGGPLVVETSTGWQQVGIVSWGEGCAAPGYPTKFTKLALYHDWIDSHINGIAMQESISFDATAKGQLESKQLVIVNNTNESADLSFRLVGSREFSLLAHTCFDLAPNDDCILTVSYKPNTGEFHSAELEISLNGELYPALRPTLFGDMVVSAASFSDVMNTDDDVIKWYTTENRPWLTDVNNDVLTSPNLGEDRYSKLLLVVEGAGQLKFDWQIDALDGEIVDWVYLDVNGVTMTYLLPEDKSILQVDLRLPEGQNKVTWVYYKSTQQSNLSDKAYIKNLVYTPALPVTEVAFVSSIFELSGSLFDATEVEETEDSIATETTTETISSDTQLNSDTNSGGGSFFYLLPLLILLPLSRFISGFSSLSH